MTWNEFTKLFIEKRNEFMETIKARAIKHGFEPPKIYEPRIEIIVEENRKAFDRDSLK